MALVTREFIHQTIKKGYIYWTITDGAKTMASYNPESSTPEQAVNNFDESFDQILDGYVNVRLSKRSNPEKAGGGDVKSDFEFRVQADPKSKVTGSSDSLNGIGAIQKLMEENSKMRSQIENQQILGMIQKQNEVIDELRKSLLEDDDDLPEDNTIGQITDFLETETGKRLLDRVLPGTKGGIAGVETETVTHTPEYVADQKSKCAQAATRLLRKDEKAGDHLLKLAELAENDPTTYQFALSKLLS